MPVLLTREADYARWLNPELSGRGAFEPLFAPHDPHAMRCYAAEK